MNKGVTLQINLAPTDLPHARHILPHQLRQWAGQVDEVLLSLDLHRSRGRYAEGWEERLPGMLKLIEECCAQYPHARSHEVDYGDAEAKAISQALFGGKPVPAKDWNGAPFYAYCSGLYHASYNYIIHMDSDMLCGGGSQTWVAEAVSLLQERSDLLACNPLAGPPTADGVLHSQTLEREPFSSPAYRSPHLSTRIFLMDRSRLEALISPPLPLLPFKRRILQALVEGNPPYRALEDIISQAMGERGSSRIDFLGQAPGMWTLHPPYRSQLFYDRLPDLIAQVETGNVPEGQRGYHDMNDSMIDWSSARKPLWQRKAKRVQVILQRFSFAR